MLEVKVAEISRTELKRLDVRFSALLTGSSNWIWGAQNEGVFRPAAIGDTEFFASYLSEDALFNLAFDAAKVNGLAKILAEPTLVAMSGETAQFNSGGEIGYPVGGGVGVTPTTEFKDFGVSVWFLPVVLDSKRISLELNIEVSELAPTLFLGAPSFLTRKARTTVELADGQTLGIAGLINEDLEENVSKFPGLGSIPVIGTLFRTQNFEKRETELLIMVTPHLVKPLIPAEVELPTDNIVESGDFGWYMQGKLQGRSKDAGGNKTRSSIRSRPIEQD